MVLLFVAAGTYAWLQAWVYGGSALFLEVGVLTFFAFKCPRMLRERGKSHEGVPLYETVFMTLWLFLSLVTFIVCGLDVVRYQVSMLPIYSIPIGFVLLVVSYVFGSWAMAVNEHFEQFARIQEEREHQVITNGPYAIVRHPGYTAIIAGTYCVPLMLQSVWALLPATLIGVLFIWRTYREDHFLQEKLSGYRAYTQRTRYRLIPFLW